MLARRLHHASFPVSDLERAKRFYGDLLGLDEIERPDLGFPGVWYGGGECEVHLIVPMGAMGDIGERPKTINPMAPHTAFAIDDYDAAVERFERHGIEVFGLGREVGQMWVQDPDGNVIELIVRPMPDPSTER
jgi:catechol 2,3-dioxygenase-like lactoylglutathione lyase family enzyme